MSPGARQIAMLSFADAGIRACGGEECGARTYRIGGVPDMLERIVVATSRVRSEVEPLVRLVQNLPVEEAVLVHCVESVLPWPSRDQAAISHAQEALERWIQEAREHTDVPMQAMVRLGIPAQQLIQAAKETRADSIVMGAFVGMPREEFFLGSTSLETIRYSHTHMLILHPPGTEEPLGGGLQGPLLEHVLFPTDFSDFSMAAFDELIGLAGRGLQRVTLLHIQDVTRIEPHLIDRLAEFDATDSSRLQQMAHRLGKKGVEAQYHVELGIPEQNIVKSAGQLQVSCIAIGSRGRTPGGQLLKWGSVSERVVRAARPPVLVIRHSSDQEAE